MALIVWYCGHCRAENRCSHVCFKCGASRRERGAQVHSSERSVVYRNPRTGELRFPARADQPVPEVYARQGYEREEIFHMSKFERDTGRVHEASNYNNNGLAERDVTGPVENAPTPAGLDE